MSDYARQISNRLVLKRDPRDNVIGGVSLQKFMSSTLLFLSDYMGLLAYGKPDTSRVRITNYTKLLKSMQQTLKVLISETPNRRKEVKTTRPTTR